MTTTHPQTSPNYRGLLLLGILALLLFAQASWAGELPRINKLADASMLFSSEPLRTVDARVTEVLTVRFAEDTGDPSVATVLRLKGPAGEFLAYMGPKRFLENRGYSFDVGQDMAVEGVNAILHGEAVLVASAFATERIMVALRTPEGSLDSTELAATTWPYLEQELSQR